MSSANASDLDQLAENECKPFLKWAGGKGQLLPQLIRRLPTSMNRYWEPFVGGGALFFALRPQGAVISDLNSDLMTCYAAVCNQPEELIIELSAYPHDSDFYYTMRALDRSAEYATLSPVRKAARLIYLNRTCYNGLFRVNSKGQFNVPFGKYVNPRIVDPDNLRACSALLKKTLLRNLRFDEVAEGAEQGDFVYFDPPYVPLSGTSDFTSYLADGFGETEQELLAVVCVKLHQRGVKWMVSNSNTPLIRELYRGFKVEEVSAVRAINSKAANRGPITELIVRN